MEIGFNKAITVLAHQNNEDIIVISHDIKSGFTQLVTTLEGPAKHTYKVYVIKYQIEGYMAIWTNIIYMILFGIIIGISWRYSKFKDDGNFASYCFILSSILLVCTLIRILINMPEDVSMALNPEYHAIDKIISTFTK